MKNLSYECNKCGRKSASLKAWLELGSAEHDDFFIANNIPGRACYVASNHSVDALLLKGLFYLVLLLARKARCIHR